MMHYGKGLLYALKEICAKRESNATPLGSGQWEQCSDQAEESCA